MPEEGDLQRSDYTTTVVLAGSEHRKPERPSAKARAQRLPASSERPSERGSEPKPKLRRTVKTPTTQPAEADVQEA